MKIIWKSCHACDFSEVERIPRRFWMRLLPRLRHYYCAKCGMAFLAPKNVVEAKQWMLSTFRDLPVPPSAATKPEGPGH